MNENYINWKQPILKHQNHLPHWQQENCFQFVTWHLGDSISLSALKGIKFLKQKWMKSHPKPWDEFTKKEYYTKFEGRIQKWLDAGIGSCLLREKELRNLVESCLWHRNESDYFLDAFVIMPNHVHALLMPLNKQSLERILQSWKSVSSHRINKYLNKTGTLWMEDYWDRMIRNKTHHIRVRNYIQNNPKKANLPETSYTLWMRED